MDKGQLKKLIDVAAGRRKADLVLKNCQIANVYNAGLIKGDIAISDSFIAGIGNYSGIEEKDIKNARDKLGRVCQEEGLRFFRNPQEVMSISWETAVAELLEKCNELLVHSL